MDRIWPKLVKKRPALLRLPENMHAFRELEDCPCQGVVGDGLTLQSSPLNQIKVLLNLGELRRLKGRHLNTST